MRTQALQTILRVSARVLIQPLPLYRVTSAARAASNSYNQCNTWRLNYNFASQDARFFSSRYSSDDSSDQSDTEAGVSDSRDTEAGGLHLRDELEKSDVDELSEDDTSDDTIYSDHEIFEAFQSELTLDDDKEEKEAKASQRRTHTDRLSQEEPCKDEHEKKPWNRKERVKACLDKLQRGPDGRYINVLEVATEVDMLIASYLKLRYQDDPSLEENSDEDEKLLEGIDIEKFKRLSKRLRDGTYEFQPIVQVPLPKKKIVKRKKKKLKKQHAFWNGLKCHGMSSSSPIFSMCARSAPCENVIADLSASLQIHLKIEIFCIFKIFV